MISVICTTYNMRPYLQRCIESVINQTYRDIEIIIVDDGSTDDTGGLLDQIRQRDPRIKTITQENKGHSAARNAGTRESSGECLYFIDADDYIHPHTLQILHGNLKTGDADISIGNVTRGELQRGGLVNRFRTYTPDEALEIVTDCRYGPIQDPRKLPFTATWNKVYKRELFKDIRFPEGRTHDDNFTVHRFMAAAQRIAFTSAVTYRYTYKENSISNDGLYSNTDMIQAYEDRVRFFEEQGLDRYLPDTVGYLMYVYSMTYERTKDAGIKVQADEFYNRNKDIIDGHRVGRTNYERIKILFEKNNSLC